MLGGLDMWTNTLARVSAFGTMKHGLADWQTLKPLAAVKPLSYVQARRQARPSTRPPRSICPNTTHEENQPPHLVLADPSIPIARNLPTYGEPARLYCPAGVYEVVYARTRRPRPILAS